MWIKQFFESLNKITDILNPGRLLFYTSAGFLVFYPILMIYRLLVCNNLELTHFLSDIKRLAPTDSWEILGGSLIMGFLIAALGFTTVLKPLSKQMSAQYNDDKDEKNSFPFRYPHMKNNIEEDYQAWLIAEFYRYVEIVTYIPLGFLLGLTFLFVYTVIYLLLHAVSKPFVEAADGYVFLLVLSAVLGISWFGAWEQFWKPRVIEETLRTYTRAKKHLIRGIEDFQKRCQENKVPVPGK